MNIAYNMDCMDAMREMPDKHYELAVVDPPYGVGSITYAPGTRHKRPGGYIDKYDVTMAIIDMQQRASVKSKRLTSVEHGDVGKSTHKGFGDENVNPPPEYFAELFRVSKNQIIWGGNYFLLPPSRGFLVWRKTTVAESFSMAMCEYAWMSLNENAKFWEGAPQGTAADPRIHPTQKPVALYAWIFKNYAKPGDRILDTHLGSGSSRIAAYDMGLDFTGYELDKHYFDLQEQRFAAHTAQGNLFLGAGT